MRHRGMVRVVALLVAGVLILASCSSDDDGGDGDGASGSTTTVAGGTTSGGGGGGGDGDGSGDESGSGSGSGSGDGGGGEPIERYADYESVSYDDPAHWVCRPDTPDDICHSDLDSTTVEADGTLTVEPFEAAEDPPIDCFYVYPTISRDEGLTSDWEASDAEEGYVTLNQAARLRSQCRVFAPIYRQNTLTALTARMGGEQVEAAEGEEDVDPYADVLDAFRTYMATDNGGRGVVLIGHSQGSGMLNRLIAEEIDPNDDVRELLVSAYLAGSSVAVPEGEDVGGDFQNVPACRSTDQTGCVVSWATFRSTEPPPDDTFFGRPRSGEGVALCTNPAALDGSDVELRSYFGAAHDASILAAEEDPPEPGGWVEESAGEVTTPFVTTPGLVTGTCVSEGGFNYLSVTVHGDPADPRADDIPGDLTPEWGLHLVDVGLVMGDIEALVGEQAKAFGG